MISPPPKNRNDIVIRCHELARLLTAIARTTPSVEMLEIILKLAISVNRDTVAVGRWANDQLQERKDD